ncbi:TonB-dependent receptor domain-containing protein [Enterobacter hormaechei subsp. steigerwaltii]
MRYYTATSSGQVAVRLKPLRPRHAFRHRGARRYLDDKIDIGNWTITPGMRFEHIESYQNNAIKGTHEEVSYNAPLPALNVLYHLTDSWNLYANTEGSFGTVQYSQIGKAVQSGKCGNGKSVNLGNRYPLR